MRARTQWQSGAVGAVEQRSKSPEQKGEERRDDGNYGVAGGGTDGRNCPCVESRAMYSRLRDHEEHHACSVVVGRKNKVPAFAILPVAGVVETLMRGAILSEMQTTLHLQPRDISRKPTTQ